MGVKFKIRYSTHWGQSLFLEWKISQEDKHNSLFIKEMCFVSTNEWMFDMPIQNSQRFIYYRYALKLENGEVVYEFGPYRKFKIPSVQTAITLIDQWRFPCGDSPFLTDFFKNHIYTRSKPLKASSSKKSNFFISLRAPRVAQNQHVSIVGNCTMLGNWNENKAIRMADNMFPFWTLSLQTESLNFPLEYKYLLVNSLTNEVLAWENGMNRCVESFSENECHVVNDEALNLMFDNWKGAGVAIPIFSIRTDDGFGIGEFNDLKQMVDWAKSVGLRMIQTLPVNDTTLHHSNKDSYPYNAVSVFALHPAYLNLESIGKLKNKKLWDYFLAQKEILNRNLFVDYECVMRIKWEFFRLIYVQEGNTVLLSNDYKRFFRKNKEWLIPYAVFSYLRDLYGTHNFNNWPTNNVFKRREIEAYSNPDHPCYNEVALYFFLQYHLTLQLESVHQYAKENGIALKGDLPIGVSPTSVDVWMYPQLFNLNGQAGAPPDDFSSTGQNWGFPTYNWERMEETGFSWWKKRFQNLSGFFDAYRIDHVLGFFRIWEIPVDAVLGLTGYFRPSLPFSIPELESMGLKWNSDRFLKPYITKESLENLFGETAPKIISVFFEGRRDGTYSFKQEYNTQKKLEMIYKSISENADYLNIAIYYKLLQLHCEVLFIQDPDDNDKFHPRISPYDTASFHDLDNDTKSIFKAIHNHFYYFKHNSFWRNEAIKKLPVLISATEMLVCGEDLGMVPHSVPEVMASLEILSLEIQRMPKKANANFAMPADAPYFSVCTTSTHDMNPLRAWWEEDKNTTQLFYNTALGCNGDAPEVCEPWIVERIIDQHLESPSMWVVLPWQDWMGIDATLSNTDPKVERINVPSNPDNFWCYRMHLSLNKLIKEVDFNSRLKAKIDLSHR